MISWIVKMLLFWQYQKVSRLDRGGENIVRYFDPSPLDIFTPINNRWQSFVCISHLHDKIYH